MNITLGSVSTDTLREKDLLPCFISELLSLDPENEIGLKYESELGAMKDKEDFWETDDCRWAMSDVVEEIDHLLDSVPYIYFGSHPGDGADFGFWIDLETMESDVSKNLLTIHDDNATIKEGEKGIVINGVGDYSMYRGQNLLWSS